MVPLQPSDIPGLISSRKVKETEVKRIKEAPGSAAETATAGKSCSVDMKVANRTKEQIQRIRLIRIFLSIVLFFLPKACNK